MKELFKNKKIKRILSSFLILLILISSLTIVGVSDVNAADSNDRRRTVIKLAQGAQLTEMEELQDMSYDDLRSFAFFNFFSKRGFGFVIENYNFIRLLNLASLIIVLLIRFM